METDRDAVIRKHLASLRMSLQHLREAQNQPKPFDAQIGMKPVKELADIMAAIENDLPGVAPEFKPQDYVVFQSLKGQPRYENLKVQSFVEQAIDCLEAAREA